MSTGSLGMDPLEHYRNREAAAKTETARLDLRVTRLSRVRTFAFFVMAAPFLLLETTSRTLWPLFIGSGTAALLIFVWLIRRHRREKRDLRRSRLEETLALEAQARLRRSWDELPAPPIGPAPPDHPSAGDLDLVGRASLAHLVGRVVTAPGRALLRQILLDPFAPLPADGAALLDRIQAAPPSPTAVPWSGWVADLNERQEAVRVLAGETAFRERLALLGREIDGGGSAGDAAEFLNWLGRPAWLSDRKGILLGGRVLAVFTPTTFVTWLLGWTPGILPVIGALGALALHRVVAPHAAERFAAAEAGQGDLAGWSALFAAAESGPAGSVRLDRLRESLTKPAPGATRSIRALLRITDTAGVRRSSLAHFPLVALFAWDIHTLDWLERWQRAHGPAAGSWIRSLGEIEVLAALGGLRFDHPDWVFPSVSIESNDGLRGAALGHPLLEPDSCVRNDVEVPAPGSLLLVSGSNMAGKTTLLRAIGANQVLALAGAPVVATKFETRPLLPWTAMRVRDSLESGVSYFLAELQRLKRVVDAARAHPSLYLLDEILQGTNSAERRTAARIVLEQLLETPAVGAITTHDLTLAETDGLQERAVNVHFREEVRETEGHRRLEFDYRLRPGPATSRNALLLLEIVGLGQRPSTE